jgi:hypothetical protein
MTTGNHPPAAPPPDADDERLPCGRLLSQVWAAYEDDADDDHRRACPHCREAVAGLERLETSVRRLRDRAGTGDGGRGGPFDDDLADFDPAALTRRVMDVVRLELRPGRPLPLGRPEENLRVMEAVAARALRAAAERVPGVHAGSCRIAPDPSAHRVTVTLDIHAPASAADLTALADQVRRHVRQAADDRIGLAVADIDIRITDLVQAPGPGEEGPAR